MKLLICIFTWLFCGYLALQLLIYAQPKRKISFGTASLFLATGPLGLTIGLITVALKNLPKCVMNCGDK